GIESNLQTRWRSHSQTCYHLRLLPRRALSVRPLSRDSGVPPSRAPGPKNVNFVGGFFVNEALKVVRILFSNHGSGLEMGSVQPELTMDWKVDAPGSRQYYDNLTAGKEERRPTYKRKKISA